MKQLLKISHFSVHFKYARAYMRIGRYVPEVINNDNTGIFPVFERDLSKCEIHLCDRKIYIHQFLDFFFLENIIV